VPRGVRTTKTCQGHRVNSTGSGCDPHSGKLKPATKKRSVDPEHEDHDHDHDREYDDQDWRHNGTVKHHPHGNGTGPTHHVNGTESRYEKRVVEHDWPWNYNGTGKEHPHGHGNGTDKGHPHGHGNGTEAAPVTLDKSPEKK
jgi:hypothetical protein